MVTSTVCHGYQLGNRDRHADTNHKRNIGDRHHQRSCRQVPVTDSSDHGGIDQVQRHLGQLTHNNGNCQLNCFIYLLVFPVAHVSLK